ncbi:unnamed protein product [Leptidea sinapis]|uniref:O-acyltransferase n=1 Tax=Leptidea sinapis TaxID=189913 RepID=A0A5E4Q9X7_9NEOP|nr:unnamed protein product [Leptidea sinapis]
MKPIKMDEIDSALRRRYPVVKQQQKEATQEKEEKSEFVARESPLTVLIENSLHIRAIYHIFVAIVVVLLCDTVIYDLVERGKISVGLGSVVHGFGDVRRALRIWLLQLLLALVVYPGIWIYAAGRRIINNKPGLCKIWAVLGSGGLFAIEATLFSLTCWDLGTKHLAIGSAVAVTCEMFRWAMKIYAAAVSLLPRCHNGTKPLPTFRHYLYFLFVPTLLYRDEYPRTKRIRWSVVVSHFLEVAAIIFYNCFIWERFIVPYWSEYGKEPKVEAGTVVRAMFACILPGITSFLCGFYCLLHAWFNAFAEMLRFGDRLFYEDWWTKSRYSNYFRAWNRVVHGWLRDFVYRPLSLRIGRTFAIITVFLLCRLASSTQCWGCSLVSSECYFYR